MEPSRPLFLEPALPKTDGGTSSIGPTKDFVLPEAVREQDEIARLRQENLELRERVQNLEADQAMILDINQMLLAKLHLLSDDFLLQGPGRHFHA